MNNHYAPLIELTRGGIVESVHHGVFCVVDRDGNILASQGDPGLITFPRSSEKPFQALPFLEINGDRHYGLTEKEIAIMCASHTGSDEHVAVIASLQSKTGVVEEDLLCGVHPPSDRTALFRLEKAHRQPTPNRNNCSGKHTGMLAHAKLRQFPEEDYINPEHPLQQVILTTFAEMCAMDKRKIVTGVDGCSAPNYAVPLTRFATAFARLVDPYGLPEPRASACSRITHAMTSHPEMISGPNRFDTILMQLGKGKIVAKAGAEGYQAIGLVKGALGKDSPAIGIALKVADGDSTDYQTEMHRQFDSDDPFCLTRYDTADRARPCIIVELLRQLGALDETSLQVLSNYAARPIYNWRKLVVGEMRVAFRVSL
ncbi:MAG: asparaginase [Anaerolineaceae bacterium]